jgi:hypothetical protein
MDDLMRGRSSAGDRCAGLFAREAIDRHALTDASVMHP